MTPFYVTTPIYYVNDRPHIGHCYTTTVADVAARFARLMGKRVFFLTGTDEHADKVIAKAKEHNVTPKAWADQCAGEFVKAFALLNISNDVFYRTSDEHHKRLAQSYIAKLQAQGDIYLGDYIGWYDASQDEYLTETVAKASNYLSPVTKKPLEKRTEKNYFFRLSKYEAVLRKHIDEHAGFILPEVRKNEVLGRLRDGLQDVPVSRAVKPDETFGNDWGVFMPGDPGHRVYVWIEALCNYLTAVDTPERRAFWPAGIHYMAKDILWFHAVIWPAMLTALNERLPAGVYAHSYFIRDGAKMSKSLNNFIDIDLIQAYVARYGADAFRYYLATQGPLGNNDADFTHAKFVESYNADLANGIGNATSRVGNMIGKYFDNHVPEHGGIFEHAGHCWPQIVADAVATVEQRLSVGDITGALHQGIDLVRKVDGYINITEPFKLAKKMAAADGKLPAGVSEGESAATKRQLGAILYHCAETLRVATLILSPAVPTAMAKLWSVWTCEPKAGVPLKELATFAGEHGLRPGGALSKGDALFMRADAAEAPPVAAV